MSTQPRIRINQRHNEISTAKTATYASPSALALAQREGEDAHLTGTTRSLHRRTLGLNLPGTLSSLQHKAKVAGRRSAADVLRFPQGQLA